MEGVAPSTTVTVQELREYTEAVLLLAELEPHKTVLITRHGRIVAKLIAIDEGA